MLSSSLSKMYDKEADMVKGVSEFVASWLLALEELMSDDKAEAWTEE